jgi:hypothetical protein
MPAIARPCSIGRPLARWVGAVACGAALSACASTAILEPSEFVGAPVTSVSLRCSGSYQVFDLATKEAILVTPYAPALVLGPGCRELGYEDTAGATGVRFEDAARAYFDQVKKPCRIVEGRQLLPTHSRFTYRCEAPKR